MFWGQGQCGGDEDAGGGGAELPDRGGERSLAGQAQGVCGGRDLDEFARFEGQCGVEGDGAAIDAVDFGEEACLHSVDDEGATAEAAGLLDRR